VKQLCLPILLAFSTALAGESTWTFSNGKTLRVDASAEIRKLVDDSNLIVADLPAGLAIRGAVMSESGTCLLILVSQERPSVNGKDAVGYDYAPLLRITSDNAGWHVNRVLEHAAPPMNQLHRSVSELRAVSDDGKTVILKLGEANREETPYRMAYSWQTWDLDQSRMLGEALPEPVATPDPNAEVKLQFPRSDLDDVLFFYWYIAGRSLRVDAGVGGKVDLIAPDLIPRAEVLSWMRRQLLENYGIEIHDTPGAEITVTWSADHEEAREATKRSGKNVPEARVIGMANRK
jgi:hypothetical protein